MNTDQISTFPYLSENIIDSLPESIRCYIRYLETTVQQQQVHIQEQQVRIEQLEARVRELEARLSKNSSNSSKPPGSDGLKKNQKAFEKNLIKSQELNKDMLERAWLKLRRLI